MMLGALIARLEREPDHTMPLGLRDPHSYRGYYECLAFEPAANVTVKGFLAEARQALGATFTGYKGGEYTMNEYTDVYVANYSECGDSLHPWLLEFLLGHTPTLTEEGEEG